jgi:hypothetical protein
MLIHALLRTGVRQIKKKNENIAIFILFLFLNCKNKRKTGNTAFN